MELYSDFEKLIVFAVGAMVFLPLATLCGCISRRVLFGLFFLMIFSMVEPEDLGISFYTRQQYPGATVRGFEFYLADLCAISLAAILIIRRSTFKTQWIIPLTTPYALFFLVGLIGWVFAADFLFVPDTRVLETFTAYPPDMLIFETKLYPLFELFRILKGFLIFWVTANLAKDPKTLRVFVWSVAATGAYLILMALRERYIYGAYRVAYDFRHPNDFAAYSAMIGAILLPLVFAIRTFWRSFGLGVLVVGMGGCMVLALSRSGLVIYGFALLATLALAYPRYFTLRNNVYIALGVIAVLIGSFVAWDTIEYQFTKMVSVKGSMDERLLFNEEARRMGVDHTWGVGLGNFSAWSWEKYQEDVSGDLAPGVPAHNIWYLTFAELGGFGLLAFALIWLRTYQLAIGNFFRSSGFVQMLALGVTLATVMVMLQSLLHFSYRNVAVYHLMQACVGVLIGVALWHRKPVEERGMEHLQWESNYAPA